MVLARYKLDLLPLPGNCFTLESHTLSDLVAPRPYSYLKFTDGLGNDLSDEMYLGRSDSKLRFSLSIFHQALSLANLAASIFPVHHRVLPLTGLTALFIFRNLPKGAQTAEDTHAVTFFPRAAHALLPEEPGSGSFTSKILSMEMRQGARLVGAPVTIGRCL